MSFTKYEIPGGGTQFTFDPITGAVASGAVELGGAKPLAGTVQVIGGTAGSIALQGSLDGVNWASLKDLQGTVIALTSLGAMADFSTAARYIRALGNASSGAAVVAVVVRG